MVMPDVIVLVGISLITLNANARLLLFHCDKLYTLCFSTGFSSKYSTYSFQDDSAKEIVHFELVEVLQNVVFVYD